MLNDLLNKSLCVFMTTIFMESLSQEVLTVAPVIILSAGERGGTTYRAPIKRGTSMSTGLPWDISLISLQMVPTGCPSHGGKPHKPQFTPYLGPAVGQNQQPCQLATPKGRQGMLPLVIIMCMGRGSYQGPRAVGATCHCCLGWILGGSAQSSRRNVQCHPCHMTHITCTHELQQARLQ